MPTLLPACVNDTDDCAEPLSEVAVSAPAVWVMVPPATSDTAPPEIAPVAWKPLPSLKITLPEALMPVSVAKSLVPFSMTMLPAAAVPNSEVLLILPASALSEIAPPAIRLTSPSGALHRAAERHILQRR